MPAAGAAAELETTTRCIWCSSAVDLLHVAGAEIGYLIVTVICEYKILRFGDCDDFAGTNFCDFMKSS